MRRLCASLLLLLPLPALADTIAASAPSDVSVTIYRAPYRNGGTIALNALGGFAVVTETRTVRLPAGQSTLRFEGVVDGIIPESAIVSGLPGGVIEKNRDAALLSPSALMRAAMGREITIRRTNPATGKAQSVAARIVSASPDGVVLQTAAGNEAFQCSGLPETFSYSSGAEGLSAQPVLSVVTRTARPVTATVKLTYIAEGFDWSASYTAHIAPDGKTFALGGWITLANGNSVSLRNASTQIVAGGLNREYVRRFVNDRPQVIARCWPRQTTSDIPLRPDAPYRLVRPYQAPGYERYDVELLARRLKGGRPVMEAMPMPAMAMMAPAPPPPPPAPEQLGDLKLYRVPQRTTVAAMQMKQTRLVEQGEVRFDRLLRVRLPSWSWNSGPQTFPAAILVRTRNDKANGLGLPLPAGAVVFEQEHGARTMMIGQPALRDIAEDEKIELELGTAADLTVTRRILARSQPNEPAPALPAELAEAWRAGKQVFEVELANAADQPEPVELEVIGAEAMQVTRSSHPFAKVDGKPTARLSVPANDRLIVRYVLERN